MHVTYWVGLIAIEIGSSTAQNPQKSASRPSWIKQSEVKRKPLSMMRTRIIAPRLLNYLMQSIRLYWMS